MSDVKTYGNYLQNDKEFDGLYPEIVQNICKEHWTPLHIIKLSIEFLADNTAPGTKILDIGSGAGKFCIAGALYARNARLIGVEQRGYLVEHANSVKQKTGAVNASFIEGNFTQLDLGNYSHFYFFNSFYENLDEVSKIDSTINYSESLYNYYVRYLHSGLKLMPKGTRVVTYHSLAEEIPRGYTLVERLEGDELNFWIKQ